MTAQSYAAFSRKPLANVPVPAGTYVAHSLSRHYLPPGQRLREQIEEEHTELVNELKSVKSE